MFKATWQASLKMLLVASILLFSQIKVILFIKDLVFRISLEVFDLVESLSLVQFWDFVLLPPSWCKAK